MPSLNRLLSCLLIITTATLFQCAEPAHGQSPDARLKGTASISGKVTIGDKAAFGIIVAAFGGDSYARKAAAQTTTDSEGNYRLFGLAAATYQVTALAPALITTEPNNNYPYGGKMILLSAAEAVADVDIKLARGAVITGRITDEEGKPVVEERVNLEPVTEQPGRPQIQMSPAYMNSQMYQTDDRGIYRIFGLPAGRYKVSVGSDANGFSRGRGYFAQAFYGDTNDPAKATIVELSEGAEASKIDIRLGRRGTTFSVAGRVVDSENGEPLAGVRPTYGKISKANPGSGVSIGGLPTNSRGEFRFEGLEPGRYTLYVSSRFDGGDFYSVPVAFNVVDRNVTNLEIKALRGLSLSGVVVPESDSSKDTLSLVAGAWIIANISTTSNPQTHNQGSGTIAPDGSFRIAGLSPGKASIYIYSPGNPNSRRFSLVRIERDGVDQTQGVTLQAGQSISNLRVFVSYGTGVIRGTIIFENGSPPPNSRTYVSIRKDGRLLEMGITTDARGHFRLTDVPAGNYEVTLNLGFYAPSLQSAKRPPQPLKQFVSVADDTEVEVNFTVDLKPKDGGP